MNENNKIEIGAETYYSSKLHRQLMKDVESEMDRLKKTCKRLISQLETGIEIGQAEIDFADLAIAQTHEEWNDFVTISRKQIESVRAGEEVSP